jgi:hypothetical protein
MTMKSAGYKRKSGPELSMPGSDTNDAIYPTMHVDHKSMPHLKKHKVGDTGVMKVKYKVTGSHQYKSGEGDTSLDITHYEPAEKVKDESEEKLNKEYESNEEHQPTAKQG